MALTLTIGGVSKTLRAGTLDISDMANGRATASFEIVSTDATYRPALDAAVVLADGATTIFGGLIERTTEVGVIPGAVPAIALKISAYDYNQYTQRRFVNETVVAGTLKAALTTLVTNYLAVFGVTLDAGQVDGPSLPELAYDDKLLEDALNEIATLTGGSGDPYVWNINSSKVFSMVQPATATAPFDIVTGDGHAIGDIEVEPSRDQYANTVILKVPPKTEYGRIESFVGDGVTSTFTLLYTPFMFRVVTYDSIYYETVNKTGDTEAAYWTYDPPTNTITRNVGPPGLGVPFSINFDGTFSERVTAVDAAEVALYGPWEKVITVDTVPADTTAQAMVDAYLAEHVVTPKTVRYRTHTAGLMPGQSQTLTIAERDLATTALITEVVIRDVAAKLLEYNVTALTGVVHQPGWRDVYKAWLGDKTGSGVDISSGTGTGGGNPALPDKSVQWNNAGVFGGDGAFSYYADTDSVICGGGGTSITATLADSCQAFGSNCHIADPT